MTAQFVLAVPDVRGKIHSNAQKHWWRPWLEQYLKANIGTEIHLAFREIDGG